ncbi:hypothetical protein BDK51DRAFT_34820 [Blyttiomyces helicus]|uniref:Uncharacterized protein n=1 Tax=Blyttiomyces helicus TaxID=388810 RepID=A0A4P9W4N4_9FUNG|nr:hypothetical protein BDK51DRAFT_34820 [Blyttiomyces helicus]|eukprot:RKO87319.1 hypothetical protein BDK51DRAFT_34820 [Blyttiomyces helicus]
MQAVDGADMRGDNDRRGAAGNKIEKLAAMAGSFSLPPHAKKRHSTPSPQMRGPIAVRGGEKVGKTASAEKRSAGRVALGKIVGGAEVVLAGSPVGKGQDPGGCGTCLSL